MSESRATPGATNGGWAGPKGPRVRQKRPRKSDRPATGAPDIHAPPAARRGSSRPTAGFPK